MKTLYGCPDLRARLKEKGIDWPISYGEMSMNDDISFEPPCLINASINTFAPFSVGAFTYAWGSSYTYCRIGRYCSIATDVRVGVDDHPTNWLSTSSFQYANGLGWDQFLENSGNGLLRRSERFSSHKETVIGNDVWIGHGVTIRGGVTIGNGAIIGAHSVVTKDVPDYMIVAGAPARIIRPRFSAGVVDRLMKMEWWNYAYSNFSEVRFSDIDKAIEDLDALIGSGLKKYRPEKIFSADIRLLASNVSTHGVD